MRRFKIACALLTVILLISLAGCLSVDRITARMSSYLDTAEQQNQDGDYPALADTLKELDDYYASKEWVLALFLRRDYATSALLGFSTLKSFDSEEYKTDFDAELERARTQIAVTRHLFLSFF